MLSIKNIHFGKNIVRKSDLTDKRKCSFSKQWSYRCCCMDALHGRSAKHMEKKLGGNYTKMLRAILNKSWRQHPTKQQLYGLLPSIMKTMPKLDEPDMQDTAGEVGTNSWVTYSHGPLHMDEQRQDDQLEPTYNISMLIQNVALKTCRNQWTIEKGGEKGSGISVLMMRQDNDDDDLKKKKSLPLQQYFQRFF